ncbi:hypothetical protein D3C72_1067810 [compost metagenome]
MHPFGERNFIQGFIDQWYDAVLIITFSDVIKCSVFNRLHSVWYIAIGSEQNNFDQWVLLLDLPAQGYTTGIGQFYIAQHHIYIGMCQFMQTALCITGL